jgi:hypothetical protein
MHYPHVQSLEQTVERILELGGALVDRKPLCHCGDLTLKLGGKKCITPTIPYFPKTCRL